jgi:hypothetical protein
VPTCACATRSTCPARSARGRRASAAASPRWCSSSRRRRGGCTSFPINKNQPLLGPADLKLSDTEKQKYYDFSWNAYQNKHITRTVQHKHALLAANAIKARCKDLTFEIDLSDGKWYDDEGIMVWNVAEEAVAFVGMDCFKDRLDILLPEMQRTTPDVGIERRLDWADFQPAMVFKLPNAVIEGSIDSVCDMTEKFGFNMSIAKINVPNQGTSPAQEPEDQ